MSPSSSGRLALFIFVVSACTFDPTVDPRLRLLCASDGECPGGQLCSAESPRICVAIDPGFDVQLRPLARNVYGPSTPLTATADVSLTGGQPIAWQLWLLESVRAPAMLAMGTASPGQTAYDFTADLAGASSGTALLEARFIDADGSPRSSRQPLALDFTAPTVWNVLASPQRIGAGGQLTVHFDADPDLDVAHTQVRALDAAGNTVRVLNHMAGNAFAGAVPALSAVTAITIEITPSDAFGNQGATQLFPTSTEIDTSSRDVSPWDGEGLYVEVQPLRTNPSATLHVPALLGPAEHGKIVVEPDGLERSVMTDVETLIPVSNGSADLKVRFVDDLGNETRRVDVMRRKVVVTEGDTDDSVAQRETHRAFGAARRSNGPPIALGPNGRVATAPSWVQLATDAAPADGAQLVYDPTRGRVLALGGHHQWLEPNPRTLHSNSNPGISGLGTDGWFDLDPLRVPQPVVGPNTVLAWTVHPFNGRFLLVDALGTMRQYTEDHEASALTMLQGPLPLSRPIVTVDRSTQDVVVYAARETQVLTAGSWRRFMPTAQWPAALDDAALVSVRHSGELLLIGGTGPAGALSEVWALDIPAQTWRARAPLPVPAVAAAYDEQRRRVCVLSATDRAIWCGAQPLSPPLPILAGSHASMAYEPPNDRFVVAAGVRTFLIDAATGQLATRTLDPVPPRRSRHVMAKVGSDTIVFGGTTPAGLLGDTWCLANGTRWLPVLSPGPTPREYAMATTVGLELWVFGGATGPGVHSAELWKLDLSRGCAAAQWSLEGTLPWARSAGAMVIQNNTLVVLGGAPLSAGDGGLPMIAGPLPTNRQLRTDMWSNADLPTTQPAPYYFSLTPRGSDLLMLGGSRPTGGAVIAATSVVGTPPRTASPLTLTQPLRLRRQAAAWDPGRQSAIIFGGEQEVTPTADLFAVTGDVVTQKYPPVSPGPRSAAQLVYDQPGQLLLFGGENGTTHYADVWRLELAGQRAAWAMHVPLAQLLGGLDPRTARLARLTVTAPSQGGAAHLFTGGRWEPLTPNGSTFTATVDQLERALRGEQQLSIAIAGQFGDVILENFSFTLDLERP